MSTELFMKGLFTGMMSLAFAWAVFTRYDSETGSEAAEKGRRKYRPLIHGALLPAVLAALVLLGLISCGTAPTMKMALTI